MRPPTLEEALEGFNASSSYLVLDIETTGLNPFTDKIVEFQFSGDKEDDPVYFATADKIHLLKNIRIPLLGHNLRFDIQFLFRAGVDLRSNKYHDTMLLGHLLDENRESYSLEGYALEFYGTSYKSDFWKRFKSYTEAPQTDREEYARKDILYTRKLYKDLLNKLKQDEIPESLIKHVHKLQYSLLQTECSGIKLDLPYTTNLGVKYKTEIDALVPEMRSICKDEIDLIEMQMWEKEIAKRVTEKGKARIPKPHFLFDSPKQLATLLYDGLLLPVQCDPKTKQRTTNEGALASLSGRHIIVDKLLHYRELQKVYSTYIEGYLSKAVGDRIYPSFLVHGTVTGRLAHTSPNLAQLPKKGGVRRCFIPDPGNVFISSDYSALEVCIEANLTKDTNLLRLFTEGISKHDLTARELRIPREQAKRLNFALQYRASHFKVAQILGLPEIEARKIWEAYWKLYSGCRKLQVETDRKVDRGIPIVSPFGRKRRFRPGKRNPWDRDYRQAYNFLIQSTGADITNRAFYLVDQELRQKGLGKGLFSIHDELLIEVKKEFAKEAEECLNRTMISIGTELGFRIPLKTESSGPTNGWED